MEREETIGKMQTMVEPDVWSVNDIERTRVEVYDIDITLVFGNGRLRVHS